MNGDINDLKIVPRLQWPEGAVEDETLYSLEVERARSLNEETGEWDLIDPRPNLESPLEYVAEEDRIGSYRAVADMATKMNQVEKSAIKVSWICSPSPISELKVA